MKKDIARLIKEKDYLSMNLVMFYDLREKAQGIDAKRHYSNEIKSTKQRLLEIESWISDINY